MVNDILTLMAHSAQTSFPLSVRLGVFTQSVTENREAKDCKMLLRPCGSNKNTNNLNYYKYVYVCTVSVVTDL